MVVLNHVQKWILDSYQILNNIKAEYLYNLIINHINKNYCHSINSLELNKIKSSVTNFGGSAPHVEKIGCDEVYFRMESYDFADPLTPLPNLRGHRELQSLRRSNTPVT